VLCTHLQLSNSRRAPNIESTVKGGPSEARPLFSQKASCHPLPNTILFDRKRPWLPSALCLGLCPFPRFGLGCSHLGCDLPRNVITVIIIFKLELSPPQVVIGMLRFRCIVLRTTSPCTPSCLIRLSGSRPSFPAEHRHQYHREALNSL